MEKTTKNGQNKRQKAGTAASTVSSRNRAYNRSLSEQKLMEAGLYAFSKYGYDGSTTRTISQKAGINESLISRYFGGKEGLLLAIMISCIHKSESEDITYPPGNTVADEFYNCFVAQQNSFKANHDFFRVFIAQAMVNPKIRRDFSKHLNEPLLGAALASRLRELRSKGKITASTDIDQVAFMASAFTGTFTFLANSVANMEETRMLDMLRLYADTLARGIST